MPLSFDRPWLLLLLGLLPLVWWIGSRGRSAADLTPQRRRFALILRLAGTLALVLALAGTNVIRTSAATCTLYVLDVSNSLPRAQREQATGFLRQSIKEMRATDRIGVVTFGGDARLAVPPIERGQLDVDVSLPAPGGGDQSNLARGITTALATFPSGMAKRIVLVSDGNETTGSLIEAARSAAASDTTIDVIPLSRPETAEASLERMLTPPDAKKGEPFPITVVADSTAATDGTIRLLRNGKDIGGQAVRLKPGKNVIRLTQKAQDAGFYTYEARLSVGARQDTLPENNRAISFVKVKGRPRILLLADAANAAPQPLSRALAAQQVDVDLRAPGQSPTQMAQLLNYDAVVVSDVPAESFSQNQQRILQAGVRDIGLGLVMVGGDRSFGAGGYFQTPLEEALPVDMDIRKMRRFPGVALALVLDKSGSMGSPQGAGNVAGGGRGGGAIKHDLSREAAQRAVETLNAQDQVGVIAFDSAAEVVVPLTYVTDPRAIERQIGSIVMGGGTEIPAGVEAAFGMLENANAKIKHIILITDGFSDRVDYSDAIARLRQEKITLTTVVINEGQSDYLKVMENLAKGTGGRFYLINDVSTIPKIYTREVQTVSKPPIVEEAFLPQVASPGHPLLSGIGWGGAPPLLGYDVVSPKPTAEVPLVSHKGDPILATWQYGLGKSVAFMSDAQPRWAAQWVGGWGSFGPFWAQAVRSVLKRGDDKGSYQSAIEQDPATGKGRITIDAVDQSGGFVNFLDAKARVVGPDGSTQVVRLQQTGSGRYVGSFDAAKIGSYVATIVQKDANGAQKVSSAGLAVPYAPEYRTMKANEPLLRRVAEITGGKARRDGEGVFTQPTPPARTPVPLAASLLLGALLLLPLDVAVRRLMLTPTQAREMASEAAGKLRARRQGLRGDRIGAAASAATVTRLRDRKARLQADEDGETTPAPRTGVAWEAPRVPTPPPAASASASGDEKRSRLLDAKRRAARAAQEDDAI